MTRRGAWLAAVAAAALGCGDSSRLRVVSGTVTQDGKPVPYGTVLVEPDEAKGGRGPQASGEINAGRFRTYDEFRAAPGPSLIRVEAYDGVVTADDGSVSSRGRLLFAGVREVVIPAEGPAVFDLDFPATPPRKPKAR